MDLFIFYPEYRVLRYMTYYNAMRLHFSANQQRRTLA
jgi:hypothetical protein